MTSTLKTKAAPTGARLLRRSNRAAAPSRENRSRTSAGNGPADPVAIAQACEQSGHPELTLSMLKAKADLSVVAQRITEANAIADAGRRLRQPALAMRLIAEGVSEATARAILVDAAAMRDEAIVTDTTRRSASELRLSPALSHKAIYARLNTATNDGAWE